MGSLISSCFVSEKPTLFNSLNVKVIECKSNFLSDEISPSVHEDQVEVRSAENLAVLSHVFILCESGVVSTIKFFLETYPSLIDCINEKSSCHVADILTDLTPLQLSAACGHADVVQFLLTYSLVDVNITDSINGMSALHLAIALGQTLVVESLCKDPRLDLSLKNSDGLTAFSLAVELNYYSAVEIMLRLRPQLSLCDRDFDGNMALHQAALHPDVKILRVIIRHTECMISPPESSFTRAAYLEAENFLGETAVALLQERVVAAAAVENAPESALEMESCGPTESGGVRNMPPLFRVDEKEIATACLSVLKQAIHAAQHCAGHDVLCARNSTRSSNSSSSSSCHSVGRLERKASRSGRISGSSSSTTSDRQQSGGRGKGSGAEQAIALSWSPCNERRVRALLGEHTDSEEQDGRVDCGGLDRDQRSALLRSLD